MLIRLVYVPRDRSERRAGGEVGSINGSIANYYGWRAHATVCEEDSVGRRVICEGVLSEARDRASMYLRAIYMYLDVGQKTSRGRACPHTAMELQSRPARRMCLLPCRITESSSLGREQVVA